MGCFLAHAFRTWVVVFGLAALLAIISQLLSPIPLPWVHSHHVNIATEAASAGIVLLDARETNELIAKGTHLIFDARPEVAYQQGHLPTALSFSNAARDTGYQEYAPILDPALPVLIYCSSSTCDDAFELATFLKQMGLTDISLYLGGVVDWVENGLPLEQ